MEESTYRTNERRTAMNNKRQRLRRCETIAYGLFALFVGATAGGVIGVAGGFVTGMLRALCNSNKTETTDSE